jgi:hypothetical protein
MPSDVTSEEAEELLEPMKRTVRVTVSAPPERIATVAVDFQDGRGFRRVLRFPAPEPVPDTVKLGFAASTGPLTDVQLIRRLTVRTSRSD